MKKHLGLSAVLGLGLSVAISMPAGAAASGTILVPDGFEASLSDTRPTGHYEVVGSDLRIWTESNTSSGDKVAEYIATSTPLSQVTSTGLDYTTQAGTIPPGYQLVVDFDGDLKPDGILVGESTYDGAWWLGGHKAFPAADFVKTDAPNTGGGHGSNWYGTLTEWSAQFPDAVVTAFGFSLGSGVFGDYLLHSIDFNGVTYTFAKHVTLTAKDQCKNGGWATSTKPVYKNQGDCVSDFASVKSVAKLRAQ